MEVRATWGLRATLTAICAAAGCGSDPIGFPAFDPPTIEIERGPGSVMASVRIVPVFYAGDPLRDELVAGLAAYAGSSLAVRNVAEYGVGAVSSGTPVDLPSAAPSTLTDAGIRSFLLDRLDGTHPEWGPSDAAARATTVYVLFFPATTTITGPLGTSCVDYGAYHEATGPSGVIYAVMARCQGPPGFTLAEGLFAHAVHEIVEAATDPYLDAYNFVSEHAIAFSLALGGTEISDFCQSAADHYRDDAIGVVQRHWSNAAARAFERPCAPDDRGPFVAAIPDTPDRLTFVPATGGAMELPGIALSLGETRRIPVRLASTAPTPEWSITAVVQGRSKPLLVSLDRETGKNGDVLELEVTAVAVPPGGVGTINLISSLDGLHTWITAVGVTP